MTRLEAIQADITTVEVDVIVNAANSSLLGAHRIASTALEHLQRRVHEAERETRREVDHRPRVHDSLVLLGLLRREQWKDELRKAGFRGESFGFEAGMPVGADAGGDIDPDDLPF